MLICTLMGEICLAAVQQKINGYGFLLLHCIQQKNTLKGCSGSILKNDPFTTNKFYNVNIPATRPTYSLVRQYLEMLIHVFVA